MTRLTLLRAFSTAAVALVLAAPAPPARAAKATVNAAWSAGAAPAPADAGVEVLADPAVKLGAANDGEWLTLTFTSSDPQLAHRAMRGLRLEIAGRGAKLALGFPLPHRGGVPPPRDGGPPPDGPPPEGAPGERGGPPPDMERDASFDIYGPGDDDVQHLPVQNDLGIELTLRPDRKAFVYRVRVPLARTDAHPYAADAKPGDLLTVTLDTALPRDERGPGGGGPGGRGGRGGDDGPGGMGGPGGGMGGPGGGMGAPGAGGMGGMGAMGGMGGRGGMGGHGGMRGGPPRDLGQRLNIKARVQLAKAP